MKTDVLEQAMINPRSGTYGHHVAFREFAFGVLDVPLEKMSMAFAGEVSPARSAN
jgi:hypothetical protein